MDILKVKNSVVSNPLDIEKLNLTIEELHFLKAMLVPLFSTDLRIANEKISFLQKEVELLKNDQNCFGLHLFNALEVILQDKRAFYETGTVTFKLKDGNFSKEVSVDPKDLVCVYTPVKGRKKAFIIRTDVISPTGLHRETYRLYALNNNDLNYEEIKRMIDPISSRFVQIAKNTLVNVAYYRFDKKDELIFERELVNQVDFSRFSIKMKEAADLFALVKMHWQENYSLQKRITDYMNGETSSGRP